MVITHSDQVTKLLTDLARAKQLRDARPFALYSTASCTATAEEFIGILLGKYPSAPDMIRGMALTSNTSFYFDIPEAEVIEKLKAIKPRGQGKTAPKVLVRMIYTRIVKVYDAIDALKVNKAREKASKSKHKYFQQFTVPEITWEAILVGRVFVTSTPYVQDLARDAAMVANRTDVTKAIADQAWGLFQAHVVMRS